MAEQNFQSLTGKVTFWNNKPEELTVGDVVTGKVALIQEARSARASRTAIIEQEDGTTLGVWLSTIIEGAFASGVHEGDTVRITYKGKATSKNGNEYNDYEVEVARAQYITYTDYVT